MVWSSAPLLRGSCAGKSTHINPCCGNSGLSMISCALRVIDIGESREVISTFDVDLLQTGYRTPVSCVWTTVQPVWPLITRHDQSGAPRGPNSMRRSSRYHPIDHNVQKDHHFLPRLPRGGPLIPNRYVNPRQAFSAATSSHASRVVVNSYQQVCKSSATIRRRFPPLTERRGLGHWSPTRGKSTSSVCQHRLPANSNGCCKNLDSVGLYHRG
jgi:hypothetical protein